MVLCSDVVDCSVVDVEAVVVGGSVVDVSCVVVSEEGCSCRLGCCCCLCCGALFRLVVVSVVDVSCVVF